MAEFAVNNSVQASTGNTPFYLNYGRNPRTPVTVNATADRSPAGVRFTVEMQLAISRAKELMKQAQHRQKLLEDTKRQEQTFQIGEAVLLNSKNFKFKHGTKKLLPRFIWPFKVL